MDSSDILFLLGGYGGLGRRGFGRSARSKKSKPKKAPKANWFEELNAAQCKELAKAAKLKVSGSKKDVVQRLLDHEFTSQFGGNKKGYGPYHSGNMITLDGLKEECRTRCLQVSGTKLELVLRIVQHEHNTGGETLKRAATQMTTDGTEQPAAKKRKPSKPSPSTMYNRVSKKCQAGSQKKYMSYWGCKCHAPDVESLMSELLYSLKPYLESDPKLVLNGCTQIVSGCVDNFDQINRPGYFEEISSLADTVVSYAQQVRSQVPQEGLETLAHAMMEWYEVAEPYGLFSDCDMREAAHKIRHGDAVPYDKDAPQNSDEEDNDEDKKPAATK